MQNKMCKERGDHLTAVLTCSLCLEQRSPRGSTKRFHIAQDAPTQRPRQSHKQSCMGTRLTFTSTLGLQVHCGLVYSTALLVFTQPCWWPLCPVQSAPEEGTSCISTSQTRRETQRQKRYPKAPGRGGGAPGRGGGL
jgi:hypothetical protein